MVSNQLSQTDQVDQTAAESAQPTRKPPVDTAGAWARTEPLVSRLRRMEAKDQWSDGFTPPARILLLGGEGLFIENTTGERMVEVPEAQFTTLTQSRLIHKVLSLMGLDDWIFEEIKAAVGDKTSYRISVSRERTVMDDGQRVVRTGEDFAPRWQWWRV